MRSNLFVLRRRIAVVGATALVMASIGLGTPAAAGEGEELDPDPEIVETFDEAETLAEEEGGDEEGNGDGDPVTTGTVTGAITAADTGQGIEGATVTLDDEDVITATTNTAGHFTLAEIEADDYTVTVTADGYEAGSDTIEVKAEETTSVTIPLTPVDDEDVPEGPFEVDNAQFRWGINNESNNSAFFGGTFNHFSAGKIRNPGSGGNFLDPDDSRGGARWNNANGPQAGWTAEAGNVRIEKHTGDGNYRLARYGDRRTTSAGGTIGGPAVAAFSDHQVVFGGGVGEVDPEAGTAEISWTGDFTVLYYSGMSFFYLSDPVLTVDESGRGRIHATGSGFASSMEDMTIWEPVPPRSVLLADLGPVNVSDDLGFEVTPRYSGVTNGRSDQVTTGDRWGSFPRAFIDFVEVVGAGQYWYSSGGSVDGFKTPLPLQVNYDAGNPIRGTVPAPPASVNEGPVNEFTAGPSFNPGGGAANSAAPATNATAAAADAADLDDDLQIASTPVRLVASRTDTFPYSDVHWAWWAAGSLLLAASVALAGTGFVAGRATPPG